MNLIQKRGNNTSCWVLLASCTVIYNPKAGLALRLCPLVGLTRARNGEMLPPCGHFPQQRPGGTEYSQAQVGLWMYLPSKISSKASKNKHGAHFEEDNWDREIQLISVYKRIKLRKKKCKIVIYRHAIQNCNNVSPHTSQNGHDQESTDNKDYKGVTKRGLS